MDLELTPAQQAAFEAADSAAITLLEPDASRNDRDEIFPAANLIALGARGLMGVNIDPEFGGRGAGVVAYAVAVRRLASACIMTRRSAFSASTRFARKTESYRSR